MHRDLADEALRSASQDAQHSPATAQAYAQIGIARALLELAESIRSHQPPRR